MSDWIEAILRDVYGGRGWVVVADNRPGCTRIATWLRDLGAAESLQIAARDGAGEPPDPALGHCHVLGLPPGPLMQTLRGAERAFAELPPDAQALVDAFDPERTAEAIGTFTSSVGNVGRRRVFGVRPASWQRLEDKCLVDELWDAAGVRRAPSAIVPATRESLVSAARALDRGLGTVWVGDAKLGWHGGATMLRWIRDVALDAQVDEAVELLSESCDHARVMPFLEGVPCSVHGIVFPDHVVVLRPAEMVVLRRPFPSGRLEYARAATFWDPSVEGREELRSAARRVGEHLQRTLGYRGAFTLDGVMTADGFLPTELNPRVGAALPLMVPSFRAVLVHYALVEGIRADWRARELEEALLAEADGARNASFGMAFERPLTTTTIADLVFDEGRWRDSVPGETAHARATIGPGASGAFTNVVLDRASTPVGPSVAPLAVAFARWLDERFDAGIGPLEPARDLR